MSLNQLIDPVKALDVKFDNVVLTTINNLPYPPSAPEPSGNAEEYTALTDANSPFLVIANNVASFSTATSQRLVVGQGSTTIVWGGSYKYNVVSFQGNLSVNTVPTPTSGTIGIGIDLSKFPDLPTNMVLMSFNGVCVAPSNTAKTTGYIQNATNEIVIYWEFPETLQAGVVNMTFDIKFRYNTPNP